MNLSIYICMNELNDVKIESQHWYSCERTGNENKNYQSIDIDINLGNGNKTN